ncbi:MAG: hypothetical protein PHE47_08770 [Oscillospiraceae bacterium]|nr:hypothetical protein [Oscillospiraceae bacterium]
MNRIKHAVGKMPPEAGGALGERMALSEPMREAVEQWCRIYENDAPWLSDSRVKGMNLLPAISSEVARMATLELQWRVEGSSGRAEFLQRQTEPVKRQLRQFLEYAVGKGGLVLKPYLSAGRILVEPVQADAFFPTETSADGKITGAVFLEQARRGERVFTRLEEHRMTDGGVLVDNRAFVSVGADPLAREVPLESVREWANLEPQVLLQGRRTPLFVYLKMPFGNTTEPTCALGVSIAARAVELMEEADRQYSRLLWEYEGGELAVDADSTYLIGGRMPQTTRRLFRSLNTGADFYHVYNPAFRDESLRAGLNELLRRIEFACGLSYGIISDPGQREMTATEIVSAKQRLFSTVKEIQGALQQALDELLNIMDYWADFLPGVPAGGYRVQYQWDDSIVTDLAAEKEQFLQEIAAGVRKPWEFRVHFLGETADQAKAACGVTISGTGADNSSEGLLNQ